MKWVVVAYAIALPVVIMGSGLGLLVVYYGLLKKADRGRHTNKPLLMSCLIAWVVSGIAVCLFGENVVIPFFISIIAPFAAYAYIKLGKP